jgi:15-cis-phytoene synthase
LLGRPGRGAARAVNRVPEGSPAPAGGGSRDGTPNFLTSTRYLAWLYSPPDQQPAFAALCEIESELAASLRPGIDHHVAHARLQWWRDESERVGRGQPVHPLTRELVARAAGGSPGASPDISGFVDTGIWDLASATFETRKELTAYCERWASAMFEPTATLAARLVAARSAQEASVSDVALTHWRSLGAAVREIELLANLLPEAHAGRLRVPLDELERTSVDPKALANLLWPAPLAALLQERHTALRAAVSQAVASIEREGQASARGLMVWAALAWRMSLRAQSALPGMIAPKRYHAFADGWHAWRAARRANAGTLRLN